MILQTKQVEQVDHTNAIVEALALLEAIRHLRHAGHTTGGLCLKCGSFHAEWGPNEAEHCYDCDHEGETIFPLELARTIAIRVAVNGARAVKVDANGNCEVVA